MRFEFPVKSRPGFAAGSLAHTCLPEADLRLSSPHTSSPLRIPSAYDSDQAEKLNHHHLIINHGRTSVLLWSYLSISQQSLLTFS